MSDQEYVCLFQAIKVPYNDKPLRVLEESFLPASQRTLEVAKAMLMKRFEDRNYSRDYGAVWPDAVRFFDESGSEVLRYTCWEYLKEKTAREVRQSDRSVEAGADHEDAARELQTVLG